MFKTFSQKTAALDENDINYTVYSAVNKNTGIYWSANGQQGASVYAPNGDCIGEWYVFVKSNPDADAEPTYTYRPATYTDRNLDGAAICEVETRHWTEVR